MSVEFTTMSVGVVFAVSLFVAGPLSTGVVGEVFDAD
jgi:hypothetical protein